LCCRCFVDDVDDVDDVDGVDGVDGAVKSESSAEVDVF